MAENRASAFAEALQTFEQDRDLDAFARVFAPDAELLRPEQRAGEQGEDGVRAFWQQYLDQFASIRSEFSRVVEAGQLGELEWTSKGSLGGGTEVEYEGVSLLEFDDQGRVSRFATYYDTAALAHRLG
jgi:ketosteroid isomerase-like protein